MWESIWGFLTSVPLWEIALILFSKTIEVSIGTTRVILINKGYKKQGAILSFFEVLLWVFIASRVIMGIAESPLKGIVYSLGFAVGVYIGSIIENYLAFGKVLIHVICSNETGIETTKTIRNAGYGVTSLDAHGKDSDKAILMIFANRKGKNELIRLIQAQNPAAMIVVNEVSVLKGGYITPWRKIAK
ncbi:MAG: DUF2179 domain-containing protein [Acholeplasmataceae bacterium]|nr:DUF2179 domain-containing protein [Acholeplasmataceae bacterium]